MERTIKVQIETSGNLTKVCGRTCPFFVEKPHPRCYCNLFGTLAYGAEGVYCRDLACIESEVSNES